MGQKGDEGIYLKTKAALQEGGINTAWIKIHQRKLYVVVFKKTSRENIKKCQPDHCHVKDRAGIHFISDQVTSLPLSAEKAEDWAQLDKIFDK